MLTFYTGNPASQSYLPLVSTSNEAMAMRQAVGVQHTAQPLPLQLPRIAPQTLVEQHPSASVHAHRRSRLAIEEKHTYAECNLGCARSKHKLC